MELKEGISPIVVVDDVRGDLLLTQRALRQCKVFNPIHLFSTGKECVEYFGALSRQDALPSILFLDLIMSPVSGLDVLRSLRGIKAAAGCFIVALSGMADIKRVHEAYQLGAGTFMVKPVDAESIKMLMDALPKHLRREQRPDGSIIHLDRDPAVG